jgi:hypothetical protein
MLSLRHSKCRMHRSTHYSMCRSLKNTKWTPTGLASLRSCTRRSAPLPHVALDCQRPSPTKCGSAAFPGFGARLPVSHGGVVADPARRRAAYESRREVTTSLLGAQPLPPCPARSHRRATAYKHYRAVASGKLHVPMSLYFPKQRGDVWAETACCKYLFQVFQRYV